MISIQTPSGKKNLILRGIQTASGKKNIVSGKITTPDDDYTFWSAGGDTLTVTASPSQAIGALSVPATINVQTNSVTASASGGVAPYTYAWTETGTPLNTWTIVRPSDAATSFICQGLDDNSGAGDTDGNVFTCTVTDALGNTGTVEVPAFASNYGG